MPVLKIESSAPLPLPLVPGWWDAAPGAPPGRAAFLCATPVSRVRHEPDDLLPPGADVPEAVAREGVLDVAGLPVGGPVRIGERAAALLARARGTPAPWTDAAAAVRGGLARFARDEDGRPVEVQGAPDGDPEGVASVWRELRDRIVAWRLAPPAPPGWARRAVALAWLGGAASRGAWRAWADAAEAADLALAGGDLPAALRNLWNTLAFVHAAEATASREVSRARDAGAEAVIVDDGGRFALALAPAGDLADRLREAGALPFRPRPVVRGLAVRVTPGRRAPADPSAREPGALPSGGSASSPRR